MSGRFNPKVVVAVLIVGGILFAITVFGYCGEGDRPAEVTINTGKWWRVDDGRVQIANMGFGESLAMGESLETSSAALAVRTEVSCDGDYHEVLLRKGETSRSVCAIQLTLVEIIGEGEAARYQIYYDR